MNEQPFEIASPRPPWLDELLAWVSGPTTVDIVWFAWSIDPDGQPWVRHECVGHPASTVDSWRLPPPWHITDEGIAPSLNCTRCGRHVVLYHCDRKPWDVFTEAAQ